VRIYGKANEVFEAIKNISAINPDMTLKEASQRGLWSHNLKYTRTFEIGKYPHVYLNEGYTKN
jgi:hypothetical protein